MVKITCKPGLAYSASSQAATRHPLLSLFDALSDSVICAVRSMAKNWSKPPYLRKKIFAVTQGPKSDRLGRCNSERRVDSPRRGNGQLWH